MDTQCVRRNVHKVILRYVVGGIVRRHHGQIICHPAIKNDSGDAPMLNCNPATLLPCCP
jgi:hypothetical protein